MSVKRWSEGADYSSASIVRSRTHYELLHSPREKRRQKATRIGSVDHVDIIMESWTKDIKCAVCDAAWSAGVWATVGEDLLLYPVCENKKCQGQIRSDAIAENPNIN